MFYIVTYGNMIARETSVKYITAGDSHYTIAIGSEPDMQLSESEGFRELRCFFLGRRISECVAKRHELYRAFI